MQVSGVLTLSITETVVSKRNQRTNDTMGDSGLPRSLQESLDNTKVSYAQLGKSGLRVSVPILGAMSFGMSRLDLVFFLCIQSMLSLFSFPVSSINQG